MAHKVGFIDEIFALSEKAGISQSEMARRSGVPKETISRVKSQGSANLETAQKLAAAIGAKIELVPLATNVSGRAQPGKVGNSNPAMTPISIDPERRRRIRKMLQSRPKTPEQFRKKYQVQLAWSNRNVEDKTLIYKALLTGQFFVILDACVCYGLTTVQEHWLTLLECGEPISRSVLSSTNSIIESLQNAQKQSS